MYKNFRPGGEELSVLGSLSPILAIPTIIMYKFTTGNVPANLRDLNYDHLLDEKITDSTEEF